MFGAIALLGRNPVASIAGILLAVMGVVLLVSRLQLANSRLTAERQKNSISQLQGTIVNQNKALADFQAAMAAKLKVSQAALGAARAAGAVKLALPNLEPQAADDIDLASLRAAQYDQAN